MDLRADASNSSFVKPSNMKCYFVLFNVFATDILGPLHSIVWNHLTFLEYWTKSSFSILGGQLWLPYRILQKITKYYMALCLPVPTLFLSAAFLWGSTVLLWSIGSMMGNTSPSWLSFQSFPVTKLLTTLHERTFSIYLRGQYRWPDLPANINVIYYFVKDDRNHMNLPNVLLDSFVLWIT